jgi:hypothetical protein
LILISGTEKIQLASEIEPFVVAGIFQDAIA